MDAGKALILRSTLQGGCADWWSARSNNLIAAFWLNAGWKDPEAVQQRGQDMIRALHITHAGERALPLAGGAPPHALDQTSNTNHAMAPSLALQPVCSTPTAASSRYLPRLKASRPAWPA